MKERYTVRCGVFLILTKKEKDKEFILLQRRYKTGLLDGQYDISSSGHLEKGETVAEAMIRETKEEIGIDIGKDDLRYVSTMHANFNGIEYLLITFSAYNYRGVPKILEKDKCDDLRWIDIKELPENIIPTRRIMINNYLTNNIYSEFGFENLIAREE